MVINGKLHATGLESADSSGAGDHRQRIADAFRIIHAAKAAFEARGCWRLAREIEDEVARWESEVNEAQAQLPLGEGLGSGEGLHGEDPPQAEIDIDPDASGSNVGLGPLLRLPA